MLSPFFWAVVHRSAPSATPALPLVAIVPCGWGSGVFQTNRPTSAHGVLSATPEMQKRYGRPPIQYRSI
ncbi:hypothetical protein VTN02DRAFT_4682 [Thermoascus thermophilus]